MSSAVTGNMTRRPPVVATAPAHVATAAARGVGGPRDRDRYRNLTPRLVEFAALAPDDPRRRVLRDDGTLWLNIGDSYASFRDGKATPDTSRGADGGSVAFADGEGVSGSRRDELLHVWPGGIPCVAHPPCRGWGRLKHLSKVSQSELDLAVFAVGCVRRNGGILEHPAGSSLWRFLGLPRPEGAEPFRPGGPSTGWNGPPAGVRPRGSGRAGGFDGPDATMLEGRQRQGGGLASGVR